MKHDAVVKQGTNRDKIVYSQLSNIKEKKGDAEKLQAPTADEAALTAERTRQAFEKVRRVIGFGVKLRRARCLFSICFGSSVGLLVHGALLRRARVQRHPLPFSPSHRPAATDVLVWFSEISALRP